MINKSMCSILLGSIVSSALTVRFQFLSTSWPLQRRIFIFSRPFMFWMNRYLGHVLKGGL